MLLVLPSRWWALLLASLLLVAFGAAAWWLSPNQTNYAIVAFLALWSALAMAMAIVERRHSMQWWLNALVTAAAIFFAILTVAYLVWGVGFIDPEFPYLMLGIHALTQGAFSVAIVIEQYREIRLRSLSVPFGLSAGLFGLLLLINPYVPISSYQTLATGYGAVSGILLLPTVFRLRYLA